MMRIVTSKTRPAEALTVTLGVALLTCFCGNVSAQSQTVGEFWPAVDAHVRLPQNWSALGFVGLKKGEENDFQELYMAIGAGYKWGSISKTHVENIDPDKEHYFVLGGGYERLQSVSSGNTNDENRLAIQALASYRLAPRLLVSDRNRVEFRWVDGSYSTRYRNDVLGLCDVTLGEFHFSPYASAEFFYSGQYDSWNQEQYTAGIEWPYKRLLMLQTYYLRQNCTTCNPQHLNVGGLTLNLYF
jgi:hypothetical protein